jgi:FAD/FMN-containing dehydrogenase
VTASTLENFAGRLIRPDDAEYDAARIVWNAMADKRPALIARCAGVDDVTAAVRYAREQDLVVAVRGGGHSVGGFGTCDGGIVIDLSRMRRLTIDPDRRVAHVEGGAHLSQLDHEAQSLGLACPIGVVGHTGVAGLTLGGGMGRLQRKFGFTIDNLRSVDLVAADGRRLHASEDQNADLFWGVRGAGANFGVVTSFELQLHPQEPTVMHGWIAFPIERSRDVAGLVREFLANAPDEAWVSINFGVAADPPFPREQAGKPVVMVTVTHSGSLEDAERDLRSLRQGLDPLMDTFAPQLYAAVQGMNDEAMAWGQRFYMKGGFLAELSDEAIEACAAQMIDVPAGGECTLSLWSQGGAIGRVSDDAMAFTGRTAAFWLGVEATWKGVALDEPHKAWSRRSMAALKPFTTVGQYVNDAVDSDVGSVRAIYGNEKYERLVRLKRTYDPDNVFRLNANIRP